MIRPSVRLFLIIVAAVLLAGCAAPSTPTPALRTLRLPMGYIPNVQYAPFYMAVERGYFRDEGLTIDFDYSYETDGMQLVGAGELQFTLASGEQVLLARAQGLPVVYVMNWWNDFPVAVVAPASSGIIEPADLAGKRVGIPMLSGASYIGYRALLDAAGLAPDIARLDVIGFTQVEAMLAGTVDAAVVYANNEPFQIEAQGMPVTVILVSDYVPLASNGLVTNEATLQSDPELVRAVLRAVMHGLQDVLADPDTAFEVCTKYVEGLAEADQDVQRKVLDASIRLWSPEPLGVSEPEAWENMAEVLLEMGLVQSPLDVAQAYSNEYLPEP
ncbi:MAG: ABC transporter substrate-binding protein [Chloroflexi bacterium]|nr:ABC transporter substrate-binding protein [Chloroflexota bacterium]